MMASVYRLFFALIPYFASLGIFVSCTADSHNKTDPPKRQDSIAQQADTTVLPPPPPPKPISEYERTMIDSGLVNIQEYIPGILVDLKYSTDDNFVKTDVYGDLETCYLRPEAAEKLKKAQELLKELHPDFSLLVYDGTRPHRVQQIMWDVLDVPYKRNYLSPPSKGSVHNYGCAVDLSIADKDEISLDMGTDFDFFGRLAQPQLEASMLKNGQLTESQHANRLLLRNVMKKAGFYDIRTEWWHFNAFVSSQVKKRFTRIP